MLAFTTVIGNREHDQDGDSVIKVYSGLTNNRFTDFFKVKTKLTLYKIKKYFKVMPAYLRS